MAYLNLNIHPQYAYIRNRALYQKTPEKWEGVQECVIFGVTTIPGTPLLFNCQLENGAVYYRVPLHRFCHDKDAPEIPLNDATLWNSFSYHGAYTTWSWLGHQKGTVLLPEKRTIKGDYLFTIDFAEPDANVSEFSLSETPQEHKCAHVLAGDDGNYYAMPNNRILWQEPSFTVDFGRIPDYDTNRDYGNAEGEGHPKLTKAGYESQFYGEGESE